METATERRVPMEASKLLAVCAFGLAVSLCSSAQGASPPATQSSPQTSSQSSSQTQPHRTVHHVQVPDEDSPAQPAELTAAEAAIEKKDYTAADPMRSSFCGLRPNRNRPAMSKKVNTGHGFHWGRRSRRQSQKRRWQPTSMPPRFNPKKLSRIFPPGRFLNRKAKLLMLNWNTSRL